MWHWSKGACFHSLTIAFSYALFALGLAFEAILQFPEAAESAGLAQYIPPKWIGWYTLGIAVLTWIARLRSIFGFFKERDHDVASQSGPGPA